MNFDKKDGQFQAVKLIIKKNKGVTCGGCVKDNEGKIVVEDEKL